MRQRVLRIVVAAPASVVLQWKEEIDKTIALLEKARGAERPRELAEAVGASRRAPRVISRS